MVVFFFLSLGLIKLSGEIKGGFGNKPMNCYGNYLFGCILQLCLNFFFFSFFFGDILQGKDLSTFCLVIIPLNIYLNLQLK